MSSALDRIIVHTNCSTCGSRIGASYVQVRTIKVFACGCGTVIHADLPTVATQVVIGLCREEEEEVGSDQGR